MAFNRLVWDCFHQGTTLGENKIGIRIEPRAGEKILFFRTDCLECRRSLKIPTGDPICDALVFYRLEAAAPILLFVEFKGNDCDHAIDQIGRTASAVMPRVPRDLRPPQVRGLIVSSRGAPRSAARFKKRLLNLGIFVQFKSGASGRVDIRPYVA